MRSPCSVCVCVFVPVSPLKHLNTLTDLYEIWYVYHTI
jgi:hypothetical protein